MTWRNQTGTDLNASYLMANFHSARRGIQAASGEKSSIVLPSCEHWESITDFRK